MRNQEALKQQGDVIWNIANLLRGPDEIRFNRHCCAHKPPHPLADIEKDIADLECDIATLVQEVTA